MKLRSLLTIAALACPGGFLIWMFQENSALRQQLADAETRSGGTAAARANIQPAHRQPGHSGPGAQGTVPARTGTPGRADGTPRAANSAPGTRGSATGQAAPGFPFAVAGNPDGSVTLTDPVTGKTFQTSVADLQSLTSEAQAAVLAHTIGKPRGPSWTPGQAAGAPDTREAGDYSTAWAPQSQDGGPEWLQVKYDRAVELSEIIIHETYNPGAVSRVVAMLPGGGERVIWEGTASTEAGIVERAVPVPPGIRSDQIRVELDTARVPGWNEIDAVEIVGRDGSRQWASESTASSYYGQGHRTVW